MMWNQEPLEDSLDERNVQADPRFIGRQDKWSHFQTIMIGRGKQGRGQGGRRERGGRVSGRANSYYSNIKNLNNNNKGLYISLGHHVLYYGQKGALDQMRTTWEKIVNHVGTIYGHDNSNELQNKKRI